MANSTFGTAFKYGALGCLGLVGVGIAVVALFSGMAFVQLRTASIEEQELAPGLPAAVEDIAGPGLVVLDLGHGEVIVEPGEALQVQATFDTRSFELIGTRETDADQAWVYRVEFRRTRRLNLSALRAIFGGGEPRIHVTLPRGMPLALRGIVQKGHSEIDLGGLALTDVDLSMAQGAMMLRVSEPTTVPLEHFAIRGKMGALLTTTLGNASPRELTLEQSMGALVADLDGAWVNDSSVSVQLTMGGGELNLPDDVTVTGLTGNMSRFNIDTQAEVPAPRLNLDLQFDMGDLKISR